MKRILFVTPYVPSPVRVRPYAFIREMASLGHKITLACLVQPAREAQYLPDVTPYCDAVYPTFLNRLEPYLFILASLPTKLPMSVAYCRSDHFEQMIKYLVKKDDYDLIHTEFVRSVPSTFRLNGRPKVYDAVDSLGLAYKRSISAAYMTPKQRMISLVEWLKVSKYESWALGHFDKVLVSSPIDRNMLEKESTSTVSVIPNGVDTGYFSFSSSNYDPDTIVFLGKMSYYVNISSVFWFYRKVFPIIKRQRPSVKLKIVGRDPVLSIRKLANDPAVEVTGTVEDVRPHLAGAALSICPMVSGAGIQNKMLESMSVGTPVVATSMACQALEASPGKDYLGADTPEAFAGHVLEVLDNPKKREMLSSNGRLYVEQIHTWNNIGQRLNAVYDNLMVDRETAGTGKGVIS
jgi:polysaccharide biosynthesis protein PslH